MCLGISLTHNICVGGELTGGVAIIIVAAASLKHGRRVRGTGGVQHTDTCGVERGCGDDYTTLYFCSVVTPEGMTVISVCITSALSHRSTKRIIRTILNFVREFEVNSMPVGLNCFQQFKFPIRLLQ